MHYSLFLETFGKRKAVASSTAPPTAKTSRLFITDKISKRDFLLDSGSDVSVIPAHRSHHNNRTCSTIYAANGSPIATYGYQTLQVDLGLRRKFSWSFIIADTSHPILGADFLVHFDLVQRLSKRKLIDMTTGLIVKCRSRELSSLGLHTVGKHCPVRELLNAYPSITRTTPVNEILHSVKHFIETRGRPVHAHARRLAPDRLKVAKQDFELMLQQGIIRPSKSPWASPLHLVPKGTNGWRSVGDYRALNAVTKADRYPIPRLHDFTSNLAGCRIFSSLDLIKGYHQIPMADEDIQKTAIITPFGLFEYLRMPFGLKNAPQTFQRFMNSLFRELDFVFVYIDDVFIASRTEEEHRIHLAIVFKILSDNGLTINLDKCQFNKTEIRFLGHLVNKDGFSPLMDKVDAVVSFPKPTSKRQLRRFLGMANFYRCFQKGIAPVAQPLFTLLSGKSKDIIWTDTTTAAFEATKKSLATKTTLNFHQPDAPLSLHTDASSDAVGAVLQQTVNNCLQPLAYFSKALDKTQQNYSTFDRELLAVYLAIKHFEYMLEGRSFVVFTDHRPLTTAMDAKTSKSPRQTRHLDFISQFTTDIRYVKGEENTVADALSRFNVNAITADKSLWSLDELASAQKADDELALLKGSSSLKPIRLDSASPVLIVCDTAKATIRPFVPKSLRRRVFDMYHNLAHPGVKGTKKLITARYFWPTATDDIKSWVDTCCSCQVSKVNRHTVVPPVQIAIPSTRFSHVNIDLVGPLPESQGNKYLLTMVDRFTRWPEAVPISNMEASTVANALVDHWVSRFGTPDTITTDQGTQFESRLFSSLCKRLGTKLIHTSAYNPRANGMVERFHRQLKASLRALNTDPSWTAKLSLILLSFRSTVKEDLKTSSAELVYGTRLRLPADITSDDLPSASSDPLEFAAQLKARLDGQQPSSTRKAPSVATKSHIPKDLSTSKHVFVRVDASRKPLDPPYTGPYEVLKRNVHTYTIRTPHGLEDINIQRLKPAKVDSRTVTFNVPRKRGRPRKVQAQPLGGSTVAVLDLPSRGLLQR